MSKSAMTAIEKAYEVIATSTTGAQIDLISYLKDEKVRKNWRNADHLACLLIDSVANAFQCETVDTLEENMYENMSQALTGYVESNLDCWHGSTWPDSLKDTTNELIRLAVMIERNNAYIRRKGEK